MRIIVLVIALFAMEICHAEEVIVNDEPGLKSEAIGRQVMYLDPSTKSKIVGWLEKGKNFAIIEQRRVNDYAKDKSTLWLHIAKLNYVITAEDYGWIIGNLYEPLMEESSAILHVINDEVHIIIGTYDQKSNQQVFISDDGRIGAFYWSDICDGYDYRTKASIYIFSRESGEIIASLDNQYFPLIEEQPSLFFSKDNKRLILMGYPMPLSRVHVFDIGNDISIWECSSIGEPPLPEGNTINMAISMDDWEEKQYQGLFEIIDKTLMPKYNEFYAESIKADPNKAVNSKLFFIFSLDINTFEYRFLRFEWVFYQ